MHPILFHWKWITIYTYGFFVALAMLAAFLIASARAKSQAISKTQITDLIFFVFLMGMLGARALYVLQHWDLYRENWAEIFYFQEGGLVWYGGFILAVTGGLLYAAKKRWPILPLCDFLAPIIAFSHGLGRIGCYWNGCCFGKITGSPLGVLFPGEKFLRYPTQIYEASLLFILSGALFFLASKHHRPGAVFMSYVLGYSFLRFFLEFLRGDQLALWGLTLPQWTSLLLFVGALFLFLSLKRKPV